jgi:hypothetical protein
MRGYSDTKPDGIPARSTQSLRRQIGENYEGFLHRNKYEYPDKPAPPEKIKCDSALGGLLNHYYVDTDHGFSEKAA